VTAPEEIRMNPALLYLYYRIINSLGIKSTYESLKNLNEYLENYCGASFIEDPEAFENILESRVEIFEISKLLTINETYFFREGVHFNVLVNLLPQLVKENRSLRVLSAATSIGCEAYSIAMLLDYHSKNGKKFDFEIDAIDINPGVIETAGNRRYTTNTLRSDSAAWKYILDLYLVQDGSEYTISNEIAGKVNFFTHNIMNKINKKYDVIFFRNTMIYFTPKTRLDAIDNITNALVDNGYLFLGVSETYSVMHPLLVNKNLLDAFFFQKNSETITTGSVIKESRNSGHLSNTDRRGDKPDMNASGYNLSNITKPAFIQQKNFTLKSPVNCTEIKSILEAEEGQTNAVMICRILTNSDGALSYYLSGSELAAAIVYLLNIQDYNNAGLVLSYLEKCNNGAITMFLRGEYFMLTDDIKSAEQFYENSAGKDKAFWPAFYRAASLAADGNPTRYKYKLEKARDSLELGRNFHYECLMSGFSPDYFERILLKKLT
jgi:chemotaxis protein methyltransferase CheR